jgi:copper(I)-binding protein
LKRTRSTGTTPRAAPVWRFAALLVACHAIESAAAQPIAVKDAWARVTVPGQSTASVYFEITSATDAALVGASSALAQSVTLHTTQRDGGVLRMRSVQRIALPAHRTVKLEPGGLHVMLSGITRPLKENETIPLALSVETAAGSRSTVTAEVKVRGLVGAHPHGHMH